MIVKNEAGNLAACINSVKAAVDEVVVVDTGSTDGTKEIAEQLGAKVFEFPWCNDFSAARNESLRHASGDYIIWLDGDDRIDPPEAAKLKRLKSMLPRRKNQAFYLVVRSDSPIEGETLFHQMRLFPNISAAEFEGRVHEQVFHNLAKAGVKSVQTDIVVRHTGYSEPNSVRKKAERNLSLILAELASTDGGNPILHFNAARTLAGLGRKREAIDHFRKVQEAGGIRDGQPRLYLEAGIFMGKCHLELGEIESAEMVFHDLSKQFPESSLVLFYLGEALLKQGDYRGAINALEKTLRFPVQVSFFPVNLAFVSFYRYHYLGVAHQCNGSPDVAREMYVKSLNLHPHHYKSLQELGVLDLKQGRYERAVAYFRRALEEGGDSAQNQVNLGLAYAKMGQQREAEGAFLNALQFDPDRLEALANLGHLYLRMENHDRARDCFLKAKNIAPNLTDVLLGLSQVHFRSMDIESLVEECDRLLEELGLRRNVTVAGFADLAALYEEIGDGLRHQGRQEVSLMAFVLAAQICPTPEVLKKLITFAARAGRLHEYLEQIKGILEEHAGDRVLIEAIDGGLQSTARGCNPLERWAL